jgi:tetratricopeptide (TPR) repeat protein
VGDSEQCLLEGSQDILYGRDSESQGDTGNVCYNADKPEEAIHYQLSTIALWREVQNPFELATALNNLGIDLLEIHEYATAQQAFLECREIDQSLGYQRGVAIALHNLGETAHKMGNNVHARGLLCESLRIRHHLGLPRGYPYSFESLAQVNASEERFEHAVQLWAAAETLRARIGAPLEHVAQKQGMAVLLISDVTKQRDSCVIFLRYRH